MAPRIKFLRVSYQQIVSRILTLSPRARELESVFRVPCEISELYAVSSIIAKQYGISKNFVARCRDGEVYASSMLDLGPGLREVEPLAYLAKMWFGIVGWSAVKFDRIVRRCVALAIENRGDRVAVLYSL